MDGLENIFNRAKDLPFLVSQPTVDDHAGRNIVMRQGKLVDNFTDDIFPLLSKDCDPLLF